MVDSNYQHLHATWYLHDNWYFLDVDQHDPLWFLFKQGRPGGSSLAGCVGHSKNFGLPADYANYLSGRKEKTFTAQQLQNMAHGNQTEPVARNWYDQKTNQLTVEVGLVIPRWEPRLCVSVDGIVLDKTKLTQPVQQYNRAQLIELAEGIIEIKCPVQMYSKLINNYYVNQMTQRYYLNIQSIDATNDENIWTNHFAHIWQSHFDQMQHGMAILRKPWCDYIVYHQDQIYLQKIPYCHQYYLKQLLQPVRQFLDCQLDPLLPVNYRQSLPSIEAFHNDQFSCRYPVNNCSSKTE